VEALQKYALGEYHANFPRKETTSKEYVFLEIFSRGLCFHYKFELRRNKKGSVTAVSKNKNIACGRNAF
jgi:hypothetical protein